MFRTFRKRSRHRRESGLAVAVLGCLLAIASFPLLFLNEGRAVKTARSLEEGAGAVVPVDANRVEAANDGKFIHVSGEARTNETLTDPQFGISVEAIRLTRSVQMYQWREEEKETTNRNSNGRTTKKKQYHYEMVWASQHLNSDSFHDAANHQNPPEIPFVNRTVQASNVQIGEYQLTRGLIDRIDKPEPLIVDIAAVPAELSANLRPETGIDSSASGLYWSAESPSDRRLAAQSGQQAAEHHGTPRIGDVRIHFRVTYPTQISIMAQQVDNTFRPFETRAGRTLEMLSLGIVAADEMIHQAETQNAFLTWALRVVGSLILILGIGLILQPLSKLTEWVPLLGKLVGTGTVLIAILLGTAFSLLTISTAWLFYRPLVAVPLIAISVVLLAFLFRSSRRAQPTQPTTPPPPPTVPPPIPPQPTRNSPTRNQ